MINTKKRADFCTEIISNLEKLHTICQLLNMNTHTKVQMNKRNNNINDALRYHGLSVIIRNEEEFNHIKKFLSEDVLYLNFTPQMTHTTTSIVIWSDNKNFDTGSVGCTEYQKKNFFRIVEFNDFFKI